MNSPEPSGSKFGLNVNIENVPEEEVSSALQRLEAIHDMEGILGPKAKEIENEIKKAGEDIKGEKKEMRDKEIKGLFPKESGSYNNLNQETTSNYLNSEKTDSAKLEIFESKSADNMPEYRKKRLQEIGDFVDSLDEMIRNDNNSLAEVIPYEVNILNTTGRRFTREVVSFYTLKAIDKFKAQKIRNFFGASLQRLDDILEIGISSIKKDNKIWARFDLMFFPTFGPFEKVKAKLSGTHIPERAYKSFYVNDVGDVILEDSNTQP